MAPDPSRFTTTTRDPIVRPPVHIPRFVGYKVTDLAPAPNPYDHFEARALNDDGLIVGDYRQGGRSYAFGWTSWSGVKRLADPGVDAGATCVNASGVIGGWRRSSWTSKRRAVVWRANVVGDLGAPAGSDSVAADINNQDVVVGELDGHAFCSQGGQLVDLGTLGGPRSSAVAINNAGQIVGWSEINGNGTRHAFACDGPGQPLRDLGHLGGGWSVARDINDDGLIVGYSPDVHFWVHACIWQNGAVTDLGHLGGGYSNAIAVNSGGTIVGVSAYSTTNALTHGFVYGHLGLLGASGPAMMDLNAKLTPSTGQPEFDGAWAINESGQLLASNRFPIRFLLTPVIVLS